MYKVKPGTSMRKRRATQKRIWLAELLCVGVSLSFVAAGECGVAAEPPSAGPSKAEIRSNPFVAPPTISANAGDAIRTNNGSIRRTSDLRQSELRLKSIGTAVGLVPIGRPRPAQTILEISAPSESRIRVNPLANHSENTLDQPIIGLVESTVVKDTPAPSVPVEFSMSDWDAPTAETASPKSDAACDVAEDSDLAEKVTADQDPLEFIIPEPSNRPNTQSPHPTSVRNSLEAERAIDPRESAQENEFARSNQPLESLPLLPPPDQAWVAANVQPEVNPEPTVVSQAVSNPFIRYPDRRRAHVQVDAPPMISFESAGASLASSEDGKKSAVVVPTPIVPVRFAGFGHAESNSAAADATSEQNEQRPEQRPKTPLQAAIEVDPLLTEIQATYPSSRIAMKKFKGRLVVHGTCADREEATEIIRLIRSKHLIPVDDKMQIR